jgi:HK97 family phage portal protein
MAERRIRAFFNLGASKREQKALIQEEQWRGSSGGVQTYSGQFVSYLNIYRSQPAVRQVIAFIAENMAQVPINVYQRVAEEQRERVTDHPAAKALENPNPEYSQFEFMRDLVTDLEIFDVAFYRKQVVNGGWYITRLFPDSVEIIAEDNLGPTVFRVRKTDGGFIDLPRSEVLYLHGYGSARGMSAMEALKQIIAEDVAGSEYREGLYKNGMRNAGVIERPLEAPDWSPLARDRFLSQLEDRHTGGASSGRPLLLEEGMTWKSDQISMRSEEYVATRELTTRIVANTYRVSPAMLGITDAPYASITEYNRQLYRNTLAPRMTFIMQSLERQLLSPDERNAAQPLYFEFNLDAKLRGSFMEQAQIAALAVGEPWMTVNEWRAIMDLPPLDDEEAANFAAVGLPALVQAGIVSPAWAAEQVGAPTEGVSDEVIPPPVDAPAVPESEQPGEPGAPNTGAGATDQPAPSEDEPKARGRKAAPDRAVVRRRDTYVEDIESELMKTFDRVLRSAKSRGFKADARWEREIKQDLRPVLERIVIAEGTRKATQLGGEFDKDYTEHYLDAAAENTARNVTAFAEDAVKRHTNDEGKVDEAALNTALSGIALKTAKGMATNLVSFARESAAKQTGTATKTWVVTTDNSRHPELDGETVKLSEPFSNGLMYPGDPSGDQEETAQCQCVLDVGRA